MIFAVPKAQLNGYPFSGPILGSAEIGTLSQRGMAQQKAPPSRKRTSGFPIQHAKTGRPKRDAPLAVLVMNSNTSLLFLKAERMIERTALQMSSNFTLLVSYQSRS